MSHLLRRCISRIRIAEHRWVSSCSGFEENTSTFTDLPEEIVAAAAGERHHEELDIVQKFGRLRKDFPCAVKFVDHHMYSLSSSALNSIHDLALKAGWSMSELDVWRKVLNAAYVYVVNTRFTGEEFAVALEHLASYGPITVDSAVSFEVTLWNNLKSVSPRECIRVLTTLSKVERWRPCHDGLSKLVHILSTQALEMTPEDFSQLCFLVVRRHCFYTAPLVEACNTFIMTHWEELSGVQMQRFTLVCFRFGKSESFEYLCKAAFKNLQSVTTDQVGTLICHAAHFGVVDRVLLEKVALFSRELWPNYSLDVLWRLLETFVKEAPDLTEAIQGILDTLAQQAGRLARKDLARVIHINCHKVPGVDASKFSEAVDQVAPEMSQSSLRHSIPIKCMKLTQRMMNVNCDPNTVCISLCEVVRGWSLSGQVNEAFLCRACEYMKANVSKVVLLHSAIAALSSLRNHPSLSGLSCSALYVYRAEALRRCEVYRKGVTDQAGLLILPGIGSSCAFLVRNFLALGNHRLFDDDVDLELQWFVRDLSFLDELSAGEYAAFLKLLVQRRYCSPGNVSAIASHFNEHHLSASMDRDCLVTFMLALGGSSLPHDDFSRFKDFFERASHAVGGFTCVELAHILAFRSPPPRYCSPKFLELVQTKILDAASQASYHDLLRAFIRLLRSCFVNGDARVLVGPLADITFAYTPRSDACGLLWFHIIVDCRIANNVMVLSDSQLRSAIGYFGEAFELTFPGYICRMFSQKLARFLDTCLRLQYIPANVLVAFEQHLELLPSRQRSRHQAVLSMLPDLKRYAAGGPVAS